MGKIRVLSTGATRALKDQISNNIDRYKSGQHDWLDELFADKKNTVRSVITDSGIVLKTGQKHSTEFDAYNAQLLYEGYPEITPAIAADERIWASLCHNQHYEYMINRWPAEPKSVKQTEKGIIEQRYFFLYGPRKSQERNGLSRLWLSAAMTYDENRSDPYELTKVLLQNTNFTFYVLGHVFGNNKRIVQGTVEAINKIQQEQGKNMSRTPLKSFTAKLNLLSGVTMLDRFSKQEIQAMAESHFREQLQKA